MNSDRVKLDLKYFILHLLAPKERMGTTINEETYKQLTHLMNGAFDDNASRILSKYVVYAFGYFVPEARKERFRTDILRL